MLLLRIPSPAKTITELDRSQWNTVLGHLRKRHDFVAFTGGEPTIRGDLPQILSDARKLGFRPIILNSNGIRLSHLKEVLNLVDIVSVSLDTLDRSVGDELYGCKKNSTGQIIHAIEHLARLQRDLNFNLNIATVLTPETFETAPELVKYAHQKHISIAFNPQVNDMKPAAELVNNSTWKRIIDELLAMKKDGLPVMNSVPFLKMLKDFDAFTCLPTLTIRVTPDGKLIYPCMAVGKPIADLTRSDLSWDAVWHAAEKTFDKAMASCPGTCYESCYAEFSQYMKDTVGTLREFYWRKKVLNNLVEE